MAPSIMSPRLEGPYLRTKRPPGSRQVSGLHDGDSVSTLGLGHSPQSSRITSRKFHASHTTNISTVVSSLQRNSGEELGASISSRLLTTTHGSILDWIRTQRMSLLPPEGSDYDKVLAWAQLFVERLHSFDLGIERFAGDSNLAAQLSYGYCALLLELGRENASALMISFGFFHSISVPLGNLLERTELFHVTQEIQEQLILALSDLVTLVASVATYFHKAISGITSSSLSVSIHRTFSAQIQIFSQRTERIAESIWRHQLLRENLNSEQVSEIKTIRSWLSPDDQAILALEEGTTHLAHDREELTCLWVAPYLTRFLKGANKHLCITGAPGSGKTVLASVIVDQLQHNHGGVSFQPLFISINARIPAQATSPAIAKSILFQLFEKRIGNVQLFLILDEAFQRTRLAADHETYDEILWTAVEQGLGAVIQGAKDLVLVVDGADEATGGEEKLLARLSAAVSKAPSTKLITLSSKGPAPAPAQARVRITEDLIFDDIVAVVRGGFDHSEIFAKLPQMDQETLVERIAAASKGSFLSAKLIVKRVREETTVEALRKTVDTLVSTKVTITDLVLHTLHHSDVTAEAKLVLLWLVTANRPLHVKEITALLSVNVEKHTVPDSPFNPLQILRPVNGLVFLQNEFFCLRHGLIGAAFLEAFATGKLIPAVKDRHADLVVRSLIYIKTHVTEQRDPSPLPALDLYDTNTLVDKHPLLDFALRYWVSHLRQTLVFKKDGATGAAKDLAKLLSTTTTVVLLQRTIWEQIPVPELLSYTTIVSTIYRGVFTVQNVVTLQSIITLAQLYRTLGRIPEALPLFHEAGKLSEKLLTVRSTVTIQIVRLFIELSVEQVTTTKTEIMVKREEMLLVLVECLKIQHGAQSEEVLTVYNQLIEHYKLIKETAKAESIIVIVQTITTSTTYQGSTGGAVGGGLNVHLFGRGKGRLEGGFVFGLDIDEEDEVIEGWESWDIEVFFKRAERYLAEGKIELAERTYVELWQRVTHESRSHYSATIEEQKMRVVLVYSQFLHTQKRVSESSSVLTSFWEDYQQRSVSITESYVSSLTKIATVMKTVGLATLALSVYKHCSEHYTSTRRTETKLYKEIQESITRTSTEVMQSVKSSSGSYVSETVLEEMIVEESRSSKKTLDQHFHSSTETLVQRYIEQHRWQEVTRVTTTILQNTWSSLFATSIQDVVLATTNVETSVALAVRLAESYHSRRQLTKEQDIRLRLYYALRVGRSVEDKLRQTAVTSLLQLLERTSQTERIISIHQELLNDYTKHYGGEHALVLKTLWILAELTRPRPIFIDYYQQIIVILNKGGHTHPDSLGPLHIVATELWVQGRYSDALHYFTVLFAAFLVDKKTVKFQDRVFVKEIFTRYTECLRAVRTEFSVLHKVTVDYRSKCKTFFGATESITVQATLTLAQLCQESRTYALEAITLYEELVQTKSEEIDIKEVTATLDALYEEQSTQISTSTRSESTSSTQIEQASKVLRKRVTTLRESYGWAHEESLVKMKEVIEFHAKHSKTELIVQELHEATVNILSSETSVTRLSAAATTIATSYIEHNQTQKVTELTEEVYRQVILRDTTNVKTSRFDLSTKRQESLIFLAQLEYHLHRQTSTVAEILATLTTEFVYFEQYHKEIKSSSSSLLTVVTSAARLYHFLGTRDRTKISHRVFTEVVTYFLATAGKKAGITETSQAHAFVTLVLTYFSSHESTDLVRSIGIASNSQVLRLIQSQHYDEAAALAVASYRYIASHESYRNPAIAKFVLALALNVSGRNTTHKPTDAARKKLLLTSATIIVDVLKVLGELKINLAQIGLEHLNTLVVLLGEHQDYKTLSWVLTALWNSREAQRDWDPYVTFALGRYFILARYLVGDLMAAVRQAEDIVYNCRRVHGSRHPSTLEMSVLLSQLYTAVALRYQAHKDGHELAHRYYKRAAAVHENILRVFSDPNQRENDGNLDESISLSGSSYGGDNNDAVLITAAAAGQYVRRHLQLLKLAVQRLGDWPKDYSEYERMNAELFLEYETELKGIEGVEKWNLKGFGGGKAEGDHDRVPSQLGEWRLLPVQAAGDDVEDEL